LSDQPHGATVTRWDSLRRVSADLSIPERTLRRAAAEGLLRGLRGALRTEPNVRLAVLFGSTATGGDNQSSDVDVLIALGDPATGRLSELSRRCSDGLGRGLHLVRLAEAEDSPALMLGVLKDGRVLVDREDMWAALKARTASWWRLARRAERPSSLAVQSAVPEQER
jgi:predicted nucleotidyltransferase